MEKKEKIFDMKNFRVTDRNTVTWKDLVCVNGKVYAEEFPIDNGFDYVDGEGVIFRMDNFVDALVKKYDCDDEAIAIYTIDGEVFDEGADLPDGFYQSGEITFGAESCGAYINGKPAEDVLAAEGLN